MNRFIKLYTWLIITVFFINTSAPIAYCEHKVADRRIDIPESLGSVSTHFNHNSSKNSKFVIYIKDVHCDYHVQKNISRILKYLIESKITSIITLEGAAGLVDTTVFSVIPDKEAKQAVCDNFTKKGILTGAESLSIIEGSDLPFTLWGAENPDLYLKNFQAFRNIKFAYENIHLTLDKINSFITNVKTKTYPDKLFVFDQQFQKLKDLKKQTVFLHKYAQTHDVSIKKYSTLSSFLNLINKEEKPIDYSLLEKEKIDLLKKIKETINQEKYEEVSILNAKFNIGSISSYEYFKALAGFIKNNDATNYPVITDFLNRENLKASIRHDLLDADLKNINADIKHNLIKNLPDPSPDNLLYIVNLVDKTSELINLHEQLFSLQLTDNELRLLLKTDLSLNHSIEKLSELALKLGLNNQIKNLPSENELKNIELASAHCEYFYNLANERSEAMVANLINKMDSESQNTAVLIAGGFHSREIERALQERQIDYAAITPNAQELDSGNYINLMMDNRLDITSPLSLPLAQYISFPVICGTMVQKSGYFMALRREMAVGLLTYRSNSIFEYRAKLTDPLSLNILDKLIAFSGLIIDNAQETAVETVITDISPQKIADQIITYDNKKLNMEIRATDPYYDDSILGRKILASYLLAVLEIAAKVNESQGSEKDLLNYIISNSGSEDKSVLREVALERLQFIEKNIEPAVKPKEKPKEKVTELNSFALQIANELSKAGLIQIPDSLTENNIQIGRKNLAGITKGGIEDRIWFEILIPAADGPAKIFHAKSSRYADFEKLGMDALKALKRDTYNYLFCPLQFKDYFGFHVTEHTGNIASDEIEPVSDMVTDYAFHLGEALAEAHLLRFIDRNSNNLRVILKDGKPVKVVNIDLTNALSQSDIQLSFQADPILSLLRKAREKGADKKLLENIALRFMSNFANSLAAMQKYYMDNKFYLENYDELAPSPRWKNTLKRLNPQLYNVVPVIKDFMDLINNEFALNLRMKSYEAHSSEISEPERIAEFINFERFIRFNPADNSIAAKIFINKMRNVFLKTDPNFIEAIQQRLPMWRLHPRTIITNSVSLVLMRLFSLSPLNIALNKIGDLVPPMYFFKTVDGIRITREDKISTGYFQKGVKYTLGEAFKILAQQGKTDQINSLIEQYFQAQLTMIKRGVFDRDPFLMQNYGIDETDILDVKCFDFGAATSFMPLALYHPFSKSKFNLSVKKLSEVIPFECVEYYKKRYNEVFNVTNIRTLWRTEEGVKAEPLPFDLNRPVEFTVLTDMNAHESFHNFLEEAQFAPFVSENSSISSDLFRSKDGKYYIKSYPSLTSTIKKRIPLWTAMPVTFFTNIVGDTLTAMSHLSPNYIARQIIGDFVPAMLEFEYKNPVRITETHYVQKGYVQQGMKYTLDKVFAQLTDKGDTRQINAVIDRFFEIQTEMLSRGIIDADTSFFQNYGVNNIYSTDIKCFDFGRTYPFLPLALGACMKGRKYNFCVQILSDMIPPECVEHYKRKYTEVFNVNNVMKIWNTKKGVQAETISISPIREDKFPDYLTGAYNTKSFVRMFLEDINMANHQELEKALTDILEKAKNSRFSLTIDDLVDDEISYRKLLASIASTRAELNQKLIGFSLAAATSINNYRTSAALMVAIQKTVLDYIANMQAEQQYKYPKKFYSIIEASL